MERILQTGMERGYGTGVWNGCGPGPCSGPYNLTSTHMDLCISSEQIEPRFFLVVKGLCTDAGASLMATQGMDLCKGWLRAASRNTSAFANWFREGSCLARTRYQVSAAGGKEGEV